jgi:hypothetical protein
MVVVTLVREGINKHRARELADHFATSPAAQRKPLTDEQKNAIVYVGPVYAPDGRVTRTPDVYRKEIEAHRLDAIRRTEAAHNIKEET